MFVADKFNNLEMFSSSYTGSESRPIELAAIPSNHESIRSRNKRQKLLSTRTSGTSSGIIQLDRTQVKHQPKLVLSKRL